MAALSACFEVTIFTLDRGVFDFVEFFGTDVAFGWLGHIGFVLLLLGLLLLLFGCSVDFDQFFSGSKKPCSFIEKTLLMVRG